MFILFCIKCQSSTAIIVWGHVGASTQRQTARDRNVVRRYTLITEKKGFGTKILILGPQKNMIFIV